MGKQFNRPQLLQGIQQLLGLKGSDPFLFEGSLLSTLSISDVDDTPFGLQSVPWMFTVPQAAVAAEFGIVLVRPPLSSDRELIVIEQIIVSNPVAGGRTFTMVYCTQTAATTAGLTTQGPVFRRRMEAGTSHVSSNQDRTAPFVEAGTHTVINIFVNVGNLIVPATDSRTFDIPKPGVVLRGDEPEKTGLAIVGNTVNEPMTVTMFGRTYQKEL